MTVAISKAAEEGAKAVICASTGNTSASAAAYAVRAGMVCAVLVPAGQDRARQDVPGAGARRQAAPGRGQLRRLPAAGARALRELPGRARQQRQPARIEGQKTAAFEIVDALGDAPDLHVLPVGNAGNITAYWRGYVEYAADGTASRTPRMWGFQAAGSAPIVNGAPVSHRPRSPRRSGSAIPASWASAVAARDESGGLIDAVTDRDILRAYRLLADPGGRLRRAGVRGRGGWSAAAARAGKLEPGQTVVCTVTGHGLKDPDWAIAGAPAPVTIPADAKAAADLLNLQA